ncbi:hypothetical protein VOLCADRAFT_120114 [Volvox carteri f. nagariensis]|uniref:Uncharacterized protein n=1 Tax=Volvox carteri f. nagariensis TaxID=3068 RepID=D8UKQ3_VOLCA|nr:uncharacterized protein VOLCADRAFT_120114 [Volvox carteri f. nagariensis]EFJ39695.1 hypothetical protein VOLCADRAFT_120114 [Volvox carteri f. nagariensis]|eukprot:XP_002959235.1 hypothetical protein VOLCADRAFT_120114 [Volvox carteri f. nagariensis]
MYHHGKSLMEWLNRCSWGRSPTPRDIWMGSHGGAASWFWRNSYTGTPLHIYPESPRLYNSFSGADSPRCPSSPVHVPVAMAYTPAPGYVMFPVMLSGAPDSPRGGLTPLMGSPVSTPTAMMFPQTPFAQHPSAGPFAPPPPQGPSAPSMRPTSISGAPQVPGGPQGPDGSSAFFHPLFNGFNAFGPPPGMPGPPPHGFASGAPPLAMPMAPPQQCAKQPRSSTAGDKGRPYQPSPLKPGPRKSSGNGGPPSGVGAFPPMTALVGRNTGTNPAAAAAGSGGNSSDVSVSPQPPSASSGARVPGRQLNAQQGYQTPAHGAYQHPSSVSGAAGPSYVRSAADGPEASPLPHQPASLSPDPSMASYGSSAARPAAINASTNATPREALDPTTAAAAAAVVAAAAAAAVNNISSGPTPRTSYTGPSVTPPPRSSLSGTLGPAAASGRTSSSGVVLPGAAAAAAAANALSANAAAVHHQAHMTLHDDSGATLSSGGLDTDGVGLSSGDVDLPPYGNFVAHGMAHHMGSHAAAAASAASAAWGFYDASAAAAAGIGNQHMWPAAAMPRLFGAAPHMIGSGIAHHLSHPHSHHQVAAMAAAAQQHVTQPQAAAAMQQPSQLLHAAMLQQLAAAANVPTAMSAMPTAMPCYVATPSLDNDYMAVAAAENLQVQLQGLQSLHGAIIASQNLRAAAAAAAVADMQQQQQHPGVMASVAASAAGLSSGAGLLMNPTAYLSGALAAHHPTHHHLQTGIHMHGLGMGGGLVGPRQRRNNNSNNAVAGSAAGAAVGTGADGQVRLNARQRRTLRRAKERAIRGLLEAGKLLVARTMGENGAEGDEGAASGCDIPSGGYDTDDGDQSEDGESPARPACVSACSASAASGGASSSPEVSANAGSNNSAAVAAGGSVNAAVASAGAGSSSAPAATKYPAAQPASSMPDSNAAGSSKHNMAVNAECRSPSSSNASSVCEAGSSGGGRAVSNTSSVGGTEAAHLGAANSTPSSSKVSPVSAEGSNEPSPAPAPAAPPRAGVNVGGDARVSPAPSGRSTSAGSASAGSAVAAAAALASGTASELDITALIQQLNQKREEGLIDEKLLRDLEIINNLIGALKSSVPSTAPSYNALGRKPSGSHPHVSHQGHQGHGNVNGGGHTMHYLNTTMQKLPKGFAIGY